MGKELKMKRLNLRVKQSGKGVIKFIVYSSLVPGRFSFSTRNLKEKAVRALEDKGGKMPSALVEKTSFSIYF